MAFVSLSTRISSLPLVLAGPLLRRTEKDNVTVWLALKEKRTVTLEIYGSETTPILYLTGSRETVKIGTNLHIVAVTATSVDNQILLPDTTYQYRLSFADDNSSSTQWLEDAGVMHSEAYQHGIYTYEPAFPTFSLPPSDINNLRIIHVSCRKPHGGKVDAFIAIDNILEAAYANMGVSGTGSPMENLAKTRPHQLFHTGDQIYADDVDDALLFMLNDASKALLGWNEDLPLGTGEEPEGYLSTAHIDIGLPTERLPDALLPGKREDIILANGFTEGSSHLMTLGEFMCMYLFTWSDVLWPLNTDDYPSFEEVYPGEPATRKIYAYARTINLGSIDSMYEQTVPSKKAGEYSENIELIKNFRSTLPRARKVLANIPSYMMCDDHEVTDDWFLNLRFTRKILGDNTFFPPFQKNQLTSRIIQNGLTAFALCQGWGNKPDNFMGTAGDEAILLSKVNQLANEQGLLLSTWNSIGNKILPYLALDGESHLKLVGGLEYYFQIDFNNYKVIVLDTRNRRRFLTKFNRKTSSADLMSVDSLNSQIPPLAQELPPNLEFTLVISPSPVLGHRFVEAGIQEAGFEFLYKAYKVSNFILPILPFLFSEPNLEIAWDKEGWAFGRTIYQDLLRRLATYTKVIVLSGDVHYSFSGQIDYWNERNIVPVNISSTSSIIAQLTASPSKNSTDTPSKDFAKYVSDKDSLPTLEFIGWQNNGYHIEKRVSSLNDPKWKSGFVKGYPDAHRFDKENERITEFSQAQVQWRYRISFAKDNRDADIRGTYTSNRATISNTILKAAEQHQHRGSKDIFRMAVGDDTIGELNFYDAYNGNNFVKAVKHSFWYNTAINSVDYPDGFLPYTIHDILLHVQPSYGLDVPGYTISD